MKRKFEEITHVQELKEKKVKKRRICVALKPVITFYPLKETKTQISISSNVGSCNHWDNNNIFIATNHWFLVY